VYTIGEISKIVNISSNTLRYYDEIGLLKPSLIQNNNQYRYYSDMQIKDIVFILELKQYGFALGEIKEFMKNKNKEKFKQMLQEKHIKLNREIERLRSNSILLEKRINEIVNEEELNMEGRRILVVDDLELSRIMIKNIIEEHGYISVGEASNGQDAVIAYEKLKPDLVIMDVVMPYMDGIDATKEITQKYKDAKIIMCSAMSSISIIMESIKAGARGFVSKPLSNISIMDSILMGIDCDSNFDIDKFENISNMLIKQSNKSIMSKSLVQKDIDKFMYEILGKDCEEEVALDFLNKINNDYINEEQYLITKSSNLEEKTIIFLRERVEETLKELAIYLFQKFKKEFLLNPLTVESITMIEFKTLVNDGDIIGVIKYKAPYSNVYIKLCSNFNDEQNVLKEMLDFIKSKLQINIPKHVIGDIVQGIDYYKDLVEDYSIVLISFSVELDKVNKGVATIVIPNFFLQY
jgi:DNA-binding NarL/FixJ family response regulator/DNA-binding transcriptional MerR regulator